jgi:hypothetical protein
MRIQCGPKQLVVWPGNDQSRRLEISVSKLIRWQANNEGAVHLSPSRAPWELALAEYRDSMSFRTAHGEYTMGVYALADVGRVARLGVEPLRAAVARGCRAEAAPQG